MIDSLAEAAAAACRPASRPMQVERSRTRFEASCVKLLRRSGKLVSLKIDRFAKFKCFRYEVELKWTLFFRAGTRRS
jgi:hypothetical protein